RSTLDVDGSNDGSSVVAHWHDHPAPGVRQSGEVASVLRDVVDYYRSLCRDRLSIHALASRETRMSRRGWPGPGNDRNLVIAHIVETHPAICSSVPDRVRGPCRAHVSRQRTRCVPFKGRERGIQVLAAVHLGTHQRRPNTEISCKGRALQECYIRLQPTASNQNAARKPGPGRRRRREAAG